jgi:hypothetical protein
MLECIPTKITYKNTKKNIWAWILRESETKTDCADETVLYVPFI